MLKIIASRHRIASPVTSSEDLDPSVSRWPSWVGVFTKEKKRRRKEEGEGDEVEGGVKKHWNEQENTVYIDCK